MRSKRKKAKGISERTEEFRSGLEDQVASQLDSLGVAYDYEAEAIPFVQPEKKRRYTPDFRIRTASGRTIFVETKGQFTTADRQKHRLVKEQHPELDIRFLFSRSKTRISKRSKTTYGAWCEKHGFQYADKVIPVEWFR